SGIPLDREFADVWEIRDGEVVEVRFYWKREDALADLGLAAQAMSEENVEVVQDIYECWGRGDFRATADKVAPEFRWEQVHVVEPGSHVGPDANRALRSVFEIYEDFRVEAEEYIDAGDVVVVVA